MGQTIIQVVNKPTVHLAYMDCNNSRTGKLSIKSQRCSNVPLILGTTDIAFSKKTTSWQIWTDLKEMTLRALLDSCPPLFSHLDLPWSTLNKMTISSLDCLFKWRSGFTIFDLDVGNPGGLDVCLGNEAYMRWLTEFWQVFVDLPMDTPRMIETADRVSHRPASDKSSHAIPLGPQPILFTYSN